MGSVPQVLNDHHSIPPLKEIQWVLLVPGDCDPFLRTATVSDLLRPLQLQLH